MKLFDDIAGARRCPAGSHKHYGRGAEMLDAQLRNATIALADIFDTFVSFVQERTAKAAAA